MEKGLNPGGWLVCKFAFKVRRTSFTLEMCADVCALQRVPGQAPLKLGGDEGNAGSSSEDEDAEGEDGEGDDTQDDDADADTD